MWVVFTACTLLVLIGICLLVSITLTKRHSLRNPRSPSDFGLKFDEVTFPSSDGISLSGWWIPSGDSQKTIVFLHGYAGSMDPDLKYTPAFHAHGYNVLMFDFRAHGRSAGRLSSIGALETRDVSGAIDYVKNKSGNSIGLLGFSMGGRTALLTAANNHEIKALVSDGGPVRLLTAISENIKQKRLHRPVAKVLAGMVMIGASLRLQVNLFANDPLPRSKYLDPIPVFFIHGDCDPYTHLDELEKMVSNAGRNAQLWRVAEAGHRDADQHRPEEYLSRIFTFFDQWMN
jgi:pimeloyl-ACP methyl ester carboxylesterase